MLVTGQWQQGVSYTSIVGRSVFPISSLGNVVHITLGIVLRMFNMLVEVEHVT